jgi:hypothetical protein
VNPYLSNSRTYANYGKNLICRTPDTVAMLYAKTSGLLGDPLTLSGWRTKKLEWPLPQRETSSWSISADLGRDITCRVLYRAKQLVFVQFRTVDWPGYEDFRQLRSGCTFPEEARTHISKSNQENGQEHRLQKLVKKLHKVMAWNRFLTRQDGLPDSGEPG